MEGIVVIKEQAFSDHFLLSLALPPIEDVAPRVLKKQTAGTGTAPPSLTRTGWVSFEFVTVLPLILLSGF